MNIEKWQITGETNISPSRWFPLFKRSFRLPSGKGVDDFIISRLGDASMVVPITKEGKVILIRQYKPGTDEIVLEFPAGRLEKGQTPMDAARAELREETGGTTEDWTLLGSLRPSPTKDSTKVYGFLARDVRITSDQDLDETEEIEIVMATPEEVEEHMAAGRINGSDCLALWLLYRMTT